MKYGKVVSENEFFFLKIARLWRTSNRKLAFGTVVMATTNILDIFDPFPKIIKWIFLHPLVKAFFRFSSFYENSYNADLTFKVFPK
jgi:ATP-dependent RNA circularization protein (DNA/RNA ligase family)